MVSAALTQEGGTPNKAYLIVKRCPSMRGLPHPKEGCEGLTLVVSATIGSMSSRKRIALGHFVAWWQKWRCWG